MEDIPLEKIYSHPVVQELLDKLNSNVSPDLESIKIPYLIKDKVLMSPGVWNNYYYGAEQIKNAFLKTKWDSKENRSLYNDHEDRRSREWVGEIVNPRMMDNNVIGDLVVVDKATAQKLAYGAKMGISPKVHGVEHNNEMVDFEFDNFSIVINPAVKTAYINNTQMEEKRMETEPKQELAATPVEPTPAPAPVLSEVDELMNEFITMENAGLADLLKKAKEIRKEGEAWKDAVARAKGMLQEVVPEKEMEEPKVEEAPVEPAKEEPAAEPVPEPEEMKCKPKVEMAQEDALNQIAKLIEMLKNKEYPAPVAPGEEKKYPEPEGEKKPYPEPDKKMEEMQDTIKLASTTAKLNEPEKKTVKAAELQTVDEEARIRGDLDNAILATFKKLGGM